MHRTNHNDNQEDKQQFKLSIRGLALLILIIFIVSSVLALLVSYLDAFVYFILRR